MTPSTLFRRASFALTLIILSIARSSLLLAQEPEDSRGAPAEPADAAEIRAQISNAENLLGKTPDRAAILYFQAESRASLHETLPALQLLKECLALKAGFDPSGDNAFAAFSSSSDFQKLVADVRKDFPLVNQSHLAFTTTEKDLFPEGLAYDPANDSFYLSSLLHHKIVKIPMHGKIEDLVPPDRDHLFPILGIRLDPSDGSIWSASSNDALAKSELLHFDRSGNLLARFPSSEPGKHEFNDLAILRSGTIFLTDSFANKIYRFDPKDHSFSTLPAPRALLFPNGIALADDQQTLFVADQFGVLRFDLQSGHATELDPGTHNTLSGIDGLYWHNGGLVAVQNGIGTSRVVLFRLSLHGSSVSKTIVLQNSLKTPTTGALRGDDFYFIVNTNIDNLNGDRILDATKLEPVRIAVVRLP